MASGEIKRGQHPGFGAEIRGLLRSDDRQDRDVAGIVIDELDELTRRRREGSSHPKELSLDGNLSEVRYLKLYKQGFSIRVYFMVRTEEIVVLAVDPNKRSTKISNSMRSTLERRLREVRGVVSSTNIKRNMR